MKTPKIAERAGSLAFIVFTFGAAGVLLGLLMAMIFSPDEAGRVTLVNWVAGSLVVALLGAVLGSIADAAPVRKPAEDGDRLAHLRPPSEPLRTPVAPSRIVAARPAGSAFRPELARR